MKQAKPNFGSKQTLIHHVAMCHDCSASCGARNALAWSHNHVKSTGHRVELQLGYSVRAD